MCATQYDPERGNPQFSLHGHSFVYIIESPAPIDLLDGRTEGGVLTKALHLAGIPVSYSLVTNTETLNVALGERLREAQSEHKAIPILHLSMHGGKAGLCLTDGTTISWEQLRSRIEVLNANLGRGLILCLSSCFGFLANSMAQTLTENPGYFALVGHPGSVEWADAAVAFTALYHRLFKGALLEDAVKAMRYASGDHAFRFDIGPATQESWRELMGLLGVGG